MASQRPPKPAAQAGFDFGTARRAPPESRTTAASEAFGEPEARIVAARDEPPRVFGVGELVRTASRTLEAKFPAVLVEGEITNLSRPRSGHVYFSLADQDGTLPAVMFRTQAVRCKFDLKEGQLVRARGRLSIFEQQGKFQLYVDSLEPAGLGVLQLAFEELKRKLAAEGLFDDTLKRPLPAWPRRIGIVTSPTGAVIRDILRVSERRGRVRTLLAAAQVQGPLAALEVRAALQRLQTIPDVDVIIIARGGGSAEDLAAFNDEALARAIRACRVPVVSAIGHEVDFTIADFVADLRAPTPSAAAELVVPLFAHLETRLDELRRRLLRAGNHVIADGRLALDDVVLRAGRSVHKRIASERRLLEEERRRLAALHPRSRLQADRSRLEALARRLESAMRGKLAERQRALGAQAPRMQQAMTKELADRRRTFETAAGTLSALSPLKVLERGYAITRAGGAVVRDAGQVKEGDEVEVLLSRGKLSCRVQSTTLSDSDREPTTGRGTGRTTS
ncbi:MAG: exodeoxyribonuclease VII large subunit [Polyangia bacterium]